MCKKKKEGVGMYGSGIMIKVIPSRELVGLSWKQHGGAAEEDGGTKNMLHLNEDFHLIRQCDEDL